MHTLQTLTLASTLALFASAKTISIDVGKGGLKFTPNTTTAAVGDVLQFNFYPLNHSVVAGTFGQACVPMGDNKGFYSGFFPTPQGTTNGQTFSVTVNSTDPMVFYCSQQNNNHCKNGMYAVVNPTGQNSLDAYGRLAGNSSQNVSPQGGAFGGVVGGSALPSLTTTPGVSGPTTTPSTVGPTNPTTTTTPGSTPGRNGAEAIAKAPVGGILGAVFAAALML